jgi:hypothetical protein
MKVVRAEILSNKYTNQYPRMVTVYLPGNVAIGVQTKKVVSEMSQILESSKAVVAQ